MLQIRCVYWIPQCSLKMATKTFPSVAAARDEIPFSLDNCLPYGFRRNSNLHSITPVALCKLRLVGSGKSVAFKSVPRTSFKKDMHRQKKKKNVKKKMFIHISGN